MPRIVDITDSFHVVGNILEVYFDFDFDIIGCIDKNRIIRLIFISGLEYKKHDTCASIIYLFIVMMYNESDVEKMFKIINRICKI